jgi:NADH:ubiquinone oxidoreductase subunit 2 (subunit N)
MAAAYQLPVNLNTSSCLLFTLMSLVLATSQLTHSALELGEAYALILAHCALILLLIGTSDWVDFTVLTAFANILLIGLTYFRRNKRLSAEISIKYLLVSLFVFCLLAIAIALSIENNPRVSGVFLWTALLLSIGATPFFNAHIDDLEAAPGFAAV